jgi:hypothetical protein
MTDEQRAAFVQLFELAEGQGSGARAARSLLCAWWNARTLGKLDPRELWALDLDNAAAARVAMLFFLERKSLDGTEFSRQMHALARRMLNDKQETP